VALAEAEAGALVLASAKLDADAAVPPSANVVLGVDAEVAGLLAAAPAPADAVDAARKVEALEDPAAPLAPELAPVMKVKEPAEAAAVPAAVPAVPEGADMNVNVPVLEPPEGAEEEEGADAAAFSVKVVAPPTAGADVKLKPPAPEALELPPATSEVGEEEEDDAAAAAGAALAGADMNENAACDCCPELLGAPPTPPAAAGVNENAGVDDAPAGCVEAEPKILGLAALPAAPPN